MIRKRNSKYYGGVKTKITCICLKKKHAPAFNLTQLARFPYKSEREPIKLQSLYKLINHHAVIKRLFHHQTGNLRQFKKKKQIMKRLKIIIFKMNINFEDRQSVL